MVAIGTLGRFLNEIDPDSKRSRLDFGMFAVVVSWIVVVIMAVLFVSGLHEKISFINWPLAVSKQIGRISLSLILHLMADFHSVQIVALGRLFPITFFSSVSSRP